VLFILNTIILKIFFNNKIVLIFLIKFFVILFLSEFFFVNVLSTPTPKTLHVLCLYRGTFGVHAVCCSFCEFLTTPTPMILLLIISCVGFGSYLFVSLPQPPSFMSLVEFLVCIVIKVSEEEEEEELNVVVVVVVVVVTVTVTVAVVVAVAVAVVGSLHTMPPPQPRPQPRSVSFATVELATPQC